MSVNSEDATLLPFAPLSEEHPDISALETRLWDAACAIRGATDAPQLKDFILPLVFYEPGQKEPEALRQSGVADTTKILNLKKMKVTISLANTPAKSTLVQVNLTMNTYAPTLPAIKREAADLMDALLARQN